MGEDNLLPFSLPAACRKKVINSNQNRPSRNEAGASQARDQRSCDRQNRKRHAQA